MENPNYYAILTADVRYCKDLTANEKILFAEITALSNKTGVCWASNNYFAELYNCTPQAISKWIKKLSNFGFISIQYEYKQGTKEIEKRIIKCINNGLTGINNDTLGINIRLGEYQHTIKDNTTSQNITKNNKSKKNNNTFDFSFVNENIRAEFLAFVEFRKILKKSWKTQNAIQKEYQNLIELSNGNYNIAKLIIQQSIDKEWLSFVPLKNKPTEPEKPNSHTYNRNFTNMSREEYLSDIR